VWLDDAGGQAWCAVDAAVTDGTLETSVTGDLSRFGDFGNALAIDSQGHIVAAGSSGNAFGLMRAFLQQARFNPGAPITETDVVAFQVGRWDGTISSMSSPASLYRLDELGWLQFDRLCSLVLEAEAGLSDLRWRGHSDTRRVARVDEQVVLGDPRMRLQGPVTVAVIWVRDERDLESRLSEFTQRLARLRGELEDRLLVLTNLDRAEVLEEVSQQTSMQRKRVAVLGAREIGASLDRTPWLRARCPPCWDYGIWGR
jgi:hypothetical protein